MRNYTDVLLSHDVNILYIDPPLSKAQVQFTSIYPYAELVGTLMYLSVLTRPDIAYHISTPIYMTCKSRSRVLNYLSRYPHLCLRYTRGSINLQDADWGACLRTRRSVSGYVVFMAGGPTAWMSKRQSIVTTSSRESEYVACYHATQEVSWQRAVLHKIDLGPTGPTVIHIDNTSARSLAGDSVFHARSKHIDVKFHWLREKVADGSMRLEYVPTNLQVANVLIKALTGEAFHQH